MTHTFDCHCGRQWSEITTGGYQSRSCSNCNDTVVGVEVDTTSLEQEVRNLKTRVERLERRPTFNPYQPRRRPSPYRGNPRYPAR